MADETNIPRDTIPPYDVVRRPALSVEIRNNNPAQSDLDNYADRNAAVNELNRNLSPDEKKSYGTITKDDVDKTLRYLVPTELKPGGSIAVKDGSLSYEELAKVAQDIDNVSTNDASLGGKMPRTFVYPEPPAKGSKDAYILSSLNLPYYQAFHKRELSYNYDSGTITTFENIPKDFTKEEFKASYGHEVAHGIELLTKNGYDEAVYNADKHSKGLVGREISQTCDSTLQNGNAPELLNNPSEQCTQDMSAIATDRPNATRQILEKNNALYRSREVLPDVYPAIAGYGNGLVSALQEIGEGSSATHPATTKRIEMIRAIQANPDAAKARLETAIAGFKRNASDMAPANHDFIAPPPPPAPAPAAGQEAVRQ